MSQLALRRGIFASQGAGGGGPASITFVNSSSVTAAAAASKNFAYVTGTSPGDLIVAMCFLNSMQTATDTLDDTGPFTPIRQDGQDVGGGSERPTFMAYRFVPGGGVSGSFTWVWSTSVSNANMVQVALRGVDPVSPIVSHAGLAQPASSGTTRTLGPMDASIPGCAVVANARSVSTGITMPGSLTSLQNGSGGTNIVRAAGYALDPDDDALSLAWGWTNTAISILQAVVLRPIGA